MNTETPTRNKREVWGRPFRQPAVHAPHPEGVFHAGKAPKWVAAEGRPAEAGRIGRRVFRCPGIVAEQNVSRSDIKGGLFGPVLQKDRSWHRASALPMEKARKTRARNNRYQAGNMNGGQPV
ncbi:hypothetical protein B4135_4297 [Caldibacillus debilis]|uniref:Uncharacterized protein n=1 Tax=Caldibacillus debilis TaxID=301148 RepID=A0A150L6J6_9BACI|nr:hypothetical protein B4135_4297 [Caldibacillus debilis]